jgi:hypothetical protein
MPVAMPAGAEQVVGDEVRHLGSECLSGVLVVAEVLAGKDPAGGRLVCRLQEARRP